MNNNQGNNEQATQEVHDSPYQTLHHMKQERYRVDQLLAIIMKKLEIPDPFLSTQELRSLILDSMEIINKQVALDERILAAELVNQTQSALADAHDKMITNARWYTEQVRLAIEEVKQSGQQDIEEFGDRLIKTFDEFIDRSDPRILELSDASSTIHAMGSPQGNAVEKILNSTNHFLINHSLNKE